MAGRPFLCWNATTAAFGQVLLLPWRSSGQLSTLPVVVAATVGPLVAVPAAR